MKVMMINGSPRANGNTSIVLDHMRDEFEGAGVGVERVDVGNKELHGCIACYSCKKTGKCGLDDIVNEATEIFKECSGLVIASPVYYSGPTGPIISFLDRFFYSPMYDRSMRVGASVAVARRAGVMPTYDVLNKYYSITNMPIAPSFYWNVVYGRDPGEAAEDAEGLHTVRMLARNMTFMMKSLKLGKETFGLPEYEPKPMTNFIR